MAAIFKSSVQNLTHYLPDLKSTDLAILWTYLLCETC